MSTEPVYPESLEPTEFWDEHKNKIIAYGALAILGLAGYGFYQWNTQTRNNASQALYAEASSAEQYQVILRDYAGTRVAGNAALQLADKLRGEKKYDEAVTVLRDFIAQYPAHPLVSGGWTSLGATYELQGKTDEALDAYRQAVSKFPKAYTAPLALTAQARILSQQGKKEEAKRSYQDVIARFPDTVFARESMRELRYLKR